MKKTTAEHDPQALARLRELIEGISIAMITTVRPDGALHSQPMYTQQMREQGELYFLVSDQSAEAEDLAAEEAVNVSYADPARQRFVSVSGNATVEHDAERIHELWAPEMKRFFPRGLDDPHLALLRVRIDTAEYWDAGSGRMQAMSDLPGTNRAAGAQPVTEHKQVAVRATPTSG